MISNRVDSYYKGNSRHADAYEHFWTSVLLGLVASHFSWVIAGIIMAIGWIVHVLIKEIILDRNKRLSGDPHEKEAFFVDMYTRNAGWLVGAILVVIIKMIKVIL